MHTYQLEGGLVDEIRFKLFDKVGETQWGEVRVRREGNPDVLVLEGRRMGERDWKPLLHLMAVGDHLLHRTFGMVSQPRPEVG